MNIIKHCKHGLMLFNHNDAYVGKSLLEYGEYSEREVELFEKLIDPGDFVVEIGANMGALTIPFANMVGPTGAVVAFEPQRMVYNILVGNTAINNLSHVYCFQEAISNFPGRKDLMELNYKYEGNFGAFSLYSDIPPKTETYRVKVSTIDKLKFKNIDFIKIDVEGMETEVLEGARNSIKSFRPIMFLENDRQDKAEDLYNILIEYNYRIFKHHTPIYNSENFLKNNRNVFPNLEFRNILCIPSEEDMPFVTYDMQEITALEDFMPEQPNHNIRETKLSTKFVEHILTYASTETKEFGNLAKADKAIDLAIEIDPYHWVLHYEKSKIQFLMHNFEKSNEYAKKALDLCDAGPQHEAMIWHRLSDSNYELNRFEEAISEEEIAISYDPDVEEYKTNLAHYHLSNADFKKGVVLQEDRFNLPKLAGRIKRYSKPKWCGEPLDDKKLLIINEQGAGDLIHYARFFPKLKETTNATVVLEVPTSQEKLTRNCNGIDGLVYRPTGKKIAIYKEPDYDYWMSLVSIPYMLNISPNENLPPNIFPVRKDIGLEFDKDKFNIGISWSGHHLHKKDYKRSCHKSWFEDLNKDSIQLYSLHKSEYTDPKWDDVESSNITDLADYISDFNDTANIIEQLDLVISVDTSAAHLSGALNTPTWLILPYSCDWRWSKKWGEQTNLYESVTLFRQHKPFDWEGVFKDIKKKLAIVRDRGDLL